MSMRDGRPTARHHRPRLDRIATGRTAAGVAAILLALTLPAAITHAQDPVTLRIGFSAPLSGPFASTTVPGMQSAQLALDEAAIPGVRLELMALDGAINGIPSPQQGARDITSFVADPSVVAVIGPYNSSTAQAQIPISSEAGLLQCAVATTNPGLTIGPEAAALRSPLAPGISFVRVVGTDDVQSAAVAHYAYTELGIRRVAVLDDTDTFGKGVADAFSRSFEALGGSIVGREGAPAGTTDYLPTLSAFAANDPDAILFGGSTASGAATVRRQMVQAGLGDLPYLGGEGLVDGTGEDAGSYLSIAGDAAGDSWSASASAADYPGREAFEAAYRERYGVSPGAYAHDAYACGQIVAAAIGRVVAAGPVSREAVRAAVTDPAATFDTALGPISFDPNGDPTVRVSSLYRTDLSVDPDPSIPGVGAWVPVARIDVPVSSPVP